MNCDVRKVARYFDERANGWDESGCSGESHVQDAILSLVNLEPGDEVVDLGCGTGVMIPHYLAANAGRVVSVDVSENMIARAKEKFRDVGSVEFVACDALELDEGDRFDAAIIYNAYPHFVDKRALAEKVFRLLKPEARFAVAHGIGRDAINRHHEAAAAEVSFGLVPVQEEADVWRARFTIESLVDTPGFYAFSGVRKES